MALTWYRAVERVRSSVKVRSSPRAHANQTSFAVQPASRWNQLSSEELLLAVRFLGAPRLHFPGHPTLFLALLV